MTVIPTTTLPSGDELPLVGFGTGSNVAKPDTPAIEAALDAGYTLFDTAEGYGTEAILGDALGTADRDDLFLTSKVLPKHLTYDALIESCEASLERLGTDYLDLYMIHWPNPAVSLRESLAALDRLHERGLVRNVGVSNFSAYLLSCANHLSDVPIAVNQVEFNPWFQRPALVDYCRSEGVVVQAAAPLGRGRVLEDECIQRLATKYDRSPAQIVLRWATQRDVAVVPKSLTPAHIRANADIFDWSLSTEDVAAIDERDRDDPGYTQRVGRDWGDDTYGIAK